MLKKYYAKTQNSKRHSLINLDEFIDSRKSTKESKAQGYYNNSTKTTEKSLVKYKSVTTPAFSLKLKPKSSQRLRTAKHKSRPSEVHPSAIIKPRNTSIKIIKKYQESHSKFEHSTNISASYDSLLQQFNCSEDLKSSFMKLITLEKLSLKNKFCLRNNLIKNKFLMSNHYSHKTELK